MFYLLQRMKQLEGCEAEPAGTACLSVSAGSYPRHIDEW